MLHYHVLNLTGDFRGPLEAPLYPLKPGVSRGPLGLSGGPGPLGPPRNSTTDFWEFLINLYTRIMRSYLR